MFDPNECPTECEKYLSRYLKCQVDFIQATKLMKSTREAPWRLEVKVNGAAQAYVLQGDLENIEFEYHVLKAMENVPIPTPRVYGLDLQGEALGVACFFSDFIEGETLLKPMLAGDPEKLAFKYQLLLNAKAGLSAHERDTLSNLEK